MKTRPTRRRKIATGAKSGGDPRRAMSRLRGRHHRRDRSGRRRRGARGILRSSGPNALVAWRLSCREGTEDDRGSCRSGRCARLQRFAFGRWLGRRTALLASARLAHRAEMRRGSRRRNSYDRSAADLQAMPRTLGRHGVRRPQPGGIHAAGLLARPARPDPGRGGAEGSSNRRDSARAGRRCRPARRWAGNAVGAFAR